MTPKFYHKAITVKGHIRSHPKTKKRTVQVKPYKRNQQYRKYPEISRARAQALFDKRSQRAKTMDLKSTSKKVLRVPTEEWEENMDRIDVKGIDTKQLEWAKDWKKAKKIQDEMKKAKLHSKKILTREEYLYDKIRNETARTGNEVAYIIDKKGKTHRIKGKKSEIDAWKVRDILKKLEDENTLIHSHPNNNTFSSNDIAEFIMSSKIRKLGVITKDGTIQEIEKPENIKKYSFDDIAKTRKRYKTAIARGIHKEHLEGKELGVYALNYFSQKHNYNLKYQEKNLIKT